MKRTLGIFAVIVLALSACKNKQSTAETKSAQPTESVAAKPAKSQRRSKKKL
jgi:hypothetical protein